MGLLDDIHTKIGNCSLCLEHLPLIKNSNLKRGDIAKIMIIGLSPGRTETITGLAFSGQAGKKLFEWLKKANIANDEAIIRNSIYFTSIIKCQKQDITEITQMFINCRGILKSQIEIVSPQIIVTLGVSVFNILFSKNLKTEEIVGRCFSFDQINETPLFPEESLIYGTNYLVPFPHPSGLNRWLNNSENQLLLNKSIAILKKLYHEKQF